MERGGIQGLPKLLEYPLLSQEWIKLRTSNLAGIFTGSSEQKPFKILGENVAWAYLGTAQFFWVPPIIFGTGKAMNFKLSRYIHRVHANKSPLKIWKNIERGRIQGLPKFLKYPLLSQEWVKLRTSNLADRFRGPCEQKPIKYLGEYLAWAYTGTSQFFWVPSIISGRDKATNFKCGTYIHRVHPNKSPLKFWEKMERGRIQGLPKFFEYPLLSQEPVKLRTSNFVRTFLVSIGTKVHYKFLEK